MPQPDRFHYLRKERNVDARWRRGKSGCVNPKRVTDWFLIYSNCGNVKEKSSWLNGHKTKQSPMKWR